MSINVENRMSQQSNNRRIAYNTILLYIRMLIVTLIGLYTSRVILLTLGIEDFGLYNVVGGVVSLFSFFRSSMERCTQRFLNVEMANHGSGLSKVFNTALLIHIGLAIIALILLETIGLWFLNAYIQIPEGREFAANVVFQTVIIGLLLTILTIPYSASIIAHEHMGLFAIISIIDSVLNLVIAISLIYTGFDKLIFYSLLLLASRLLIFLLHVLFCTLKYSETKIHLYYDKAKCKDMLGYTSWTLLGHAMILGTNNGNNVLINMFHGVSANAAMAVANQVNSHILNLTGNFQTAFNPQITKSYASGDFSYLKTLIYATTKISFFLLLLVVLPLLYNLDYILELWLVKVPKYTDIFCTLMLTSGIIQATTAPLNFSIMATGKIKWFQILTGIVFISDLFIVYFFFSQGFSAPTAMWVKVGVMILVAIVRLYYAHKFIPCITYMDYSLKVVLPLAISTGLCTVLIMIIPSPTHLINRITFSLIILATSIIIAYYCGITKQERQLIRKYIKKR